MAKAVNEDKSFTEATTTEEKSLPKIVVKKVKVSIAETSYYTQLTNQQAQLNTQISDATKSIIESRGYDYTKVLQPVSLNEDATELSFNLSE